MQLLKKKEQYQPIQGLVSEATDYNVYYETKRERLSWFLMGLLAGGGLLYIFYESLIVSLVAGIGCGIAFVPIRRKQVIKKRRQNLTNQFRSFLDSLSTSVGAGKNMYDALESARYDLANQFGDEADIVVETKTIQAGIYSNIRIEDMLKNFADRSGVEDIRNFADVFATSYGPGANTQEVIRNTAGIIGDKIQIQMELETMVAGQKNEMNIMLVMPVLFIVVMKNMGDGLVDLSSPTGLLSVTVALGLFILAYFVGQKITDIKL